MTLGADHRLFRSRSDFGYLAVGRQAVSGNAEMLRGYIFGLEIAAAACRSHIVSAAEKFGEKSDGVRVGLLDLYCIEREIRRQRARIK